MRSPERRVVHLQVGETVSSTTEHNLCEESAYFRSLLSDRNKQLPGENLFGDADPDLFAYILQYLRHGIYPVCFSQGNGHDIAKYLGIQRVAADLGIEKLAKWLVDRQYESAVECSVSFQEIRLRRSTPYPSTDQVSFLPCPPTNRLFLTKQRINTYGQAKLYSPAKSFSRRKQGSCLIYDLAFAIVKIDQVSISQ